MYPSVMISYVVGTEDRIYLACRISHRMELFDHHMGMCSVSGVQQRSDLGVVGARITKQSYNRILVPAILVAYLVWQLSWHNFGYRHDMNIIPR